MSNSTRVWSDLDEDFRRAPILVGRPATPAEIDKAETLLGVVFCEQYRTFLARYGGAMVGSLPIFGTSCPEVMGDEETVVNETLRYRTEGCPPSWYVVSNNGFGSPIGVDPKGVVWLSDHDSSDGLVRIADTFELLLVLLFQKK